MVSSTVSHTLEDVQPRWTPHLNPQIRSLVWRIPPNMSPYRVLLVAMELRVEVAKRRLSRAEREMLAITLKRYWPRGTAGLIAAALAPYGHIESLIAEAVKLEVKRHWPRGSHALVDGAVRSKAANGRNGHGRG